MRYIVAIWVLLLSVVSLGPMWLKYHFLRTGGHMHVPGHFLMFMVTAMLLCWSATSVRSRLLRAFGAFLIGFTTEWLQAVIYHNPIEWRDIRTDTLGIIAGFLIVSLFQRTSVPAHEA